MYFLASSHKSLVLLAPKTRDPYRRSKFVSEEGMWRSLDRVNTYGVSLTREQFQFVILLLLYCSEDRHFHCCWHGFIVKFPKNIDRYCKTGSENKGEETIVL